MPSPEARAAYADAIRLIEPMRQIHNQEGGLLVDLQNATNAAECARLLAKIDQLRAEWTDMFHQYSDAMARYTVALRSARQ